MGKGALGLLSAYWPEMTARHAHVPLERAPQFTVHRSAKSDPDRAALVTPGRSVTFAELSDLVRRAGAGIAERVGDGGRVAIILDDPVAQAACAFGAWEADRLAFVASGPVPFETLADFAPDLVIARVLAHAPPGVPVETAHKLLATEPVTFGKANLRAPVLVLPNPDATGEVAHNHKTLVATAVAFSSFYIFEPGAEVVLLEPPTGWLGLAVVLAAWHKATTIRAAWTPDWAGHPERVDYLAGSFAAADARYAGATPALRDVRAGVGAILGIEGPFSPARRRRLARRLGTPVLTLYGRNDLGPVLGSHPTWYLDDAVGIPLPNVDTRPLDPDGGGELTIGWDAVEEAEIGVKSALAPAGGELSGTWLRSRMLGQVDPTGLYFVR
ncbi:MAG TPA: AMP-binding protein [Acidimicrobiia bacterium]|jgi:acyl-CoA synthetase (AMP-forming)/AMP-acid ligase II